MPKAMHMWACEQPSQACREGQSLSPACSCFPGLQIKALRATISGLQASASHSTDVELTNMRSRVAQLEATLRARDKEVEKVRAIKVRRWYVGMSRAAQLLAVACVCPGLDGLCQLS